LAKQLGLFLVGKWEKRAQRFKEIEEAKWEAEPKKKKSPKSAEAPVAGEGVPVVSGQEKSDRVNALLAKLKVCSPLLLLLSDLVISKRTPSRLRFFCRRIRKNCLLCRRTKVRRILALV
jgi:hypothetical protein